MRLTPVHKGREYHVTIPAHRELSVGTLRSILGDVVAYLEIDVAAWLHDLFS